MNRLIQFAVRLYPKRWRQRYGFEFMALLDDVKPDLRTTLDVAKGALKMQMTNWSSGRIVAASAMLGALLAYGVSFSIPIKYESQVVMNIVPAFAPSTGRAEVDREIADRMNLMSQRILSEPVLTTMISDLGLYAADRSRMPMKKVVALMRRNVRIQQIPSVVPGRIAGLVIRFSDGDPYTAQRVVVGLVNRYMTENIRAGRMNWPTALELEEPATLPSKPVSPRQSRITVVGLTLGLLIGAVCAYVRRKRLSGSTGILEKNPGGVPVFRGNGVPFQALVEYLESGRTLDQFLRDFPAVTKEQAISALETAKSLLVGQFA